MRKVIHPKFPDYFVRSDGSVERRFDNQKYRKAGDILAGRILQSGYRQYNLRDRDGGPRLIRANRLVCEAFYGPAPSGKSHAAHRNGVRLDNRVENLYWASVQENIDDQVRHGTKARGIRISNQHGPAKISDDDVRVIRASYSGVRGDLVRLARQFGVYPTCIQKIVARTTWQHVT